MKAQGDGSPSANPLQRKVSRRGVLAGLALTPLALEVGRASASGVGPAPSGPGPAALASNLAQSPGRIVHNTNPPLEESPLWALEGSITPTPLHYIRNHAPTPEIDLASWRLLVDGEVDRPLELSYEQLRQLPSKSLDILIECAGNGRARFDPPAEGTPWRDGAVSVAEWTGVPLAAILELAGLRDNVAHIIAQGADAARVTRGLPPEYALRPDTLLAWAMNGEVLPPSHGFPLRLVVPNWIGVASVKWLERITASPTPLEGRYQTVSYVYDVPGKDPLPVTLLPVKAVIARPRPGASLVGGAQLISGFAWSGRGRIAAVDVSADGGQTWSPAHLDQPAQPIAWTRWSYVWQPSGAGAYTLICRATDETGATQPPTVEWNARGYSYNALVPVSVSVGTAEAAAIAATAEAAPESESTSVAVTGAVEPGQQVFQANCVTCHGDNGEGKPGADGGPRLVGGNNIVKATTREELLRYVQETMPYDAPGSLSETEYQQVVDYLRQANGL